MGTTLPIYSKEKLELFKNYYLKREKYRNYCMIVIGLNTALRISDILELKWEDVYDFSNQKFNTHIELKEQKTSKNSMIALNHSAIEALKCHREHIPAYQFQEGMYLFTGQKNDSKPIDRTQAYRIIRKAAKETGLEAHISCHSLRKTFGYFAYKAGVNSVMLMEIYNHSSYGITRKYLGITQHERDAVFESNNL